METVTASIVLYDTPEEQVLRLLRCIDESGVVATCFLIDNSPMSTGAAYSGRDGLAYHWLGRNVGYGAGHNVAIRRVLESSDFHVVVNPDVYFDAGVLETLVAFAVASPDVGQVMPRVVYPDGRLQFLCKLLPTPWDLLLRWAIPSSWAGLTSRWTDRFELRFSGYDRIMDVPYLSGCFMLFRVAALKRVGLFDERFFMYPEDIDITRRMHGQYRTVYFPGATVVHEHARASYASWRMFWIHATNMMRYFNKWGWVFDPMRHRINTETVRRIEQDISRVVR